MKILIVGAGAVGGQFGAQLHENGANVHFLLRPARKQLIDAQGLTISWPGGQTQVRPSTLTAAQLTPDFDLIILSNKAYTLDEVIADIKPAVGPDSMVLPLLNGLRHLDALDKAFGQEKVLGGIARTVATLASPTQVQLGNNQGNVSVGARAPSQQAAAQGVWQELTRRQVLAEYSEHIIDDMWDKFCRMASLGAANCLMQGTVGDYMHSDEGGHIALQLLQECTDTAQAAGHPMHPKAIEGFRRVLTSPNSSFNSSMYRDMRAGLPIEGDHLVGDMLRRAQAAGVGCAMLKVANAVLQTYSARRTA